MLRKEIKFLVEWKRKCTELPEALKTYLLIHFVNALIVQKSRPRCSKHNMGSFKGSAILSFQAVYSPQNFTVVVASPFVPPELFGALARRFEENWLKISFPLPLICPKVKRVYYRLPSAAVVPLSTPHLYYTWVDALLHYRHLLLLEMPCRRFNGFILCCSHFIMVLLAYCQEKNQKSTMAV